MNIEMFVIGILVALMIGQNVFWARYCMMLTNRIMSRNYAEVVQIESSAKRKPLSPSKPEEVFDPEDVRQAQTLNSMLGMV